MTDVHFAAVSGDASAQPQHPTDSVNPRRSLQRILFLPQTVSS
jgi:hypothetical protein